MFQRASSSTPRLKTRPCFIAQIPNLFLNVKHQRNINQFADSSINYVCWIQGYLEKLQHPEAIEISDDSCDEVTVFYRIQDRSGTILVSHIEELPRSEKAKDRFNVVLNDVCSISFCEQQEDDQNLNNDDDDFDNMFGLHNLGNNQETVKQEKVKTEMRSSDEKSVIKRRCYCMVTGVILQCSMTPVIFAFQIRELSETVPSYVPCIQIPESLIPPNHSKQCRRQREEDEKLQVKLNEKNNNQKKNNGTVSILLDEDEEDDESAKEIVILVENEGTEMLRFLANNNNKISLEDRWNRFITMMYSSKSKQR